MTPTVIEKQKDIMARYKGRQVEPHVVVPIQNVQKGKPDGRTQKAVQRVQDCSPSKGKVT